MKYIELKASLKNKVENAYLIFGDDRYLCYDALKKIEDSLSITIKDMNSVVISGEQTSAKDIVDSANMYPFGDANRLVVVKNFAPLKNKEEYKVIENYLKQPLGSTVIVFFNPDSSEFFKGMSNITPVDCSKIEPKVISAFVKNSLAKNEIQANEEAVDKLILFCDSDMTRITNELEKLIAYVSDTKVLTPDIVQDFVVQDKEYQIYELAEFIAKGDSKKAIDLVDSFMVKPGSAFVILSPLFNNYRRALFVSINKEKTSAELATLLGVKEFAIRMLKNQVAVFSPKQLKQIVDMIALYDNKIKIGEMKENVAIKTIVINILNIRG
ncbi:MAG: DNA polymerase III subunit delta [Clostridia bacterium]|nr:DNA polymerase III subunit delta [Clostridia bacterium]